MISRGDIFLADLEPVKGSEQGGIRPVLVIGNDAGSRHGPTVIIACITTKNKKPLPTHLYAQDTPCLSRGSVILLEQIRTIDKSRLIKKLGKLGNDSAKLLNEALRLSLGCSE